MSENVKENFGVENSICIGLKEAVKKMIKTVFCRKQNNADIAENIEENKDIIIAPGDMEFDQVRSFKVDKDKTLIVNGTLFNSGIININTIIISRAEVSKPKLSDLPGDNEKLFIDLFDKHKTKVATIISEKKVKIHKDIFYTSIHEMDSDNCFDDEFKENLDTKEKQPTKDITIADIVAYIKELVELNDCFELHGLAFELLDTNLIKDKPLNIRYIKNKALIPLINILDTLGYELGSEELRADRFFYD